MAELASQPTSIQSVYGWYSENRLFVNRRYQRKLVWTLEEKQKLIESVLKKYPIPAILIAEREEAAGSYEIIDGLQRLHAIVSFIEGAFPTVDGKTFNLEFFPTAKSRADEGIFEPIISESSISQKEVSTILDYSLSLSVMRNASEAEIDDVFDRINTYGHRLSDQERRQAGVQNEFSEMVRELASTLRGDESAEVLALSAMPSISIDLPMTKHGYAVRADEVFWVSQGVLRSTDLRDSMDEQCIADIAASIIDGKMIDRSKDALDEIYHRGSDISEKALTALEVYGRKKLVDEFKFCIDEILKVCGSGKTEKLRDIIFERRSTNAFPSVFAVIVYAFHDLIVRDKKKIADYDCVKKAITNVTERIETGRRATSPEERMKNVDVVKGLVAKCFVPGDLSAEIYESHTTTDIESAIRRSEIELANYELKQGIVSLGDAREVDEGAVEKIVKTICAVANNGRDRAGKIILGVSDKAADTERIKALDGIDGRPVGKRVVVGVDREARALGKQLEEYHGLIRDRIKNSPLSEPLKTSVLSNIDYNAFYGLGLIVISVPPQKELSYYGDDVYWREGDTTSLASAPKLIATIAQRF